MPEPSYKISFCGVRTYPATVGFFVNPPINVNEIKTSRGRFDVCHHAQYPEPGEVTPMLVNYLPVAAIPFLAVPGQTTYIHAARQYWLYLTPEAAWAAVLAAPLEEYFLPEVVTYGVPYYAYGSFYPGWGYDGFCTTGQQNMAPDSSLILPEWLTDDEIIFGAIVTPRVVPLGSGFVKMGVAGEVLACDGATTLIPLEKQAFSGNRYTLAPRSLPTLCSLDEARSLDSVPGPDHYGGSSSLDLIGALVLGVGRRIGCPYIIVSPEQAAKYKYVGLLDGPDGDFIGPAVPIPTLT